MTTLGQIASNSPALDVRQTLNKLLAKNIAPIGVVADGVQLTDAVVSGTSLTSASANFTNADVGKAIAIVGAGTSGANHVTTIAARVSATQITLTATAPTAIASGGWYAYGTDDTAAWQSAIDSLGSAGGRITAPPGISIIAGALVTTSGFNTQIKLPTVIVPTQSFPIEIVGTPATPNAPFWATAPHVTGSILLSFATGSGTRPAMIAGSQSTGNTQHAGFTEVKLTLTNMTLRTLPNSGICAVDGSALASFSMWQVFIDTLQSIDKQTAAPTAASHVGAYASGRGSECAWSIRDVFITGYYTGFVNGEGGYVDNLFIFSCLRAVINPAVDYPTNFGTLIFSWCPTGVLWTGAHDCAIDNVLTESWASIGHGASWMTTVYHYDDGGSSYWSGHARHWEVTAGTGRTNNLLTRGCTGAAIVCATSPAGYSPKAAETTIPNTSTWTDVHTFGLGGGGDLVVNVNLNYSLNAIAGPTTVQFRVVDVTLGTAVTGSFFTAWYSDSAGAETRILHASRTVLIRCPGPYGRQYKIQALATYTSGTSVVVHADAFAAGGSNIVRHST